MNKTKKFILNALILTLTSVALRMAAVSLTVYVSGKIGAEGIGVFQLLSSVYMFAVTLATSGIGLTVTRLVAEELATQSHSGVKAALRRCVGYSVVCGALAAVLLAGFAPLIAEHWLHGKISAMPIYVLAVSLPFLAVSSVFSGYFTAVRRVAKSASGLILEQTIKIAVTIFCVNLLVPGSFDAACMALVLGGTAAEILSCAYRAVMLLFDQKRYRKQTQVDGMLSRRMFHIAIPVALSSYIRSALSTFKQVMIPIGLEKHGVSCETAIAQYGMIGGMVMPVLMFPSALLSAFSALLVPEMAENNLLQHEKTISNIIARIFKITLIFSICVSGLLFFYADDLCMAIYHNLDVAIYIKVFAPLIIVMYFDEIVDALLKGLGEQVSVVRINIADTVICIALLSILLPAYGIKGYIAVFFVSEIFNVFLSVYRLIKTTKFEIKILWWIVWPVAAIIMAALLARSLIPAHFILSMIAAVVIYLTVLYLSGSITDRDFAL